MLDIKFTTLLPVGGWCNFCEKHVASLQELRLDGKRVAIGCEKCLDAIVEKARKLVEKDPYIH